MLSPIPQPARREIYTCPVSRAIGIRGRPVTPSGIAPVAGLAAIAKVQEFARGKYH